MHGPIWLENPIISLALLAIGFYLLYRATITEKHHREPQHSNSSYSLEKKLFGHKIIDTSKGWLFFTSFLVLVALGAHFLAEYTFHLYDITPIDRFTHGLSGMALTAIVLNLYLTRKRKYYYTVSIAASWVPFVLWEVYEWIYATYSGPSGFIQTEPWDMAIDLWIDSLGALAICFLYDEFTEG
jgi:hypothetical protein